MICPGCQHDNRAARRYCGRCGCNFEPACEGCGFANDHGDRFCGGCGHGLRVRGAQVSPAAAAAAREASRPVVATVAGTAQAAPWDARELAELFAPAPVADDTPGLPEVGISQNDVDRLFGSVP